FCSCSSSIFLKLLRNQTGFGATGGPNFAPKGASDTFPGAVLDGGSEDPSVAKPLRLDMFGWSLVAAGLLWMFTGCVPSAARLQGRWWILVRSSGGLFERRTQGS
uniref:Uncharacterized protein n=1 Tax=Gasterosteus aculeatus TaxID=69293 RepID=G3PFU5_GASAC